MRTVLLSLAALLVVIGDAPARGDGLLYQLPADGSWVEFDVSFAFTRRDDTREGTGSCRMASVGQETVEGKECRWIELKLTMKFGEDPPRTVIAKTLIPEEQLREGQQPIDNRVRGWIRMGNNSNVSELTESKLGPMRVFMANALENQKKLAAEVIESKLGRLSCEGVHGTLKYKERGADCEAEIESRRNPKAPFGVVASTITAVTMRDGVQAEKAVFRFKLRDAGDGAQSELPGVGEKLKGSREGVAKLQGSWHIHSISIQGMSISRLDLQDAEAVIDEKKVHFKNALENKSQSSFLRVGKVSEDSPAHRPVFKSMMTKLQFETKDAEWPYDATTDPQQIDCQVAEQASAKVLGIYTLDGETLTICFALPGVDRPTELAPGPKRFVIVLQKKKPQVPEALTASLQQEMKRLQGTWAVESGWYDTEKLSEKDRQGFRLTFEEAGLTWEEAGTTAKLAVQLDPDSTPAAINLTVTDGPDKGRVIKGVYQLEKGRLTLRLPATFGNNRPMGKDLTQSVGADAVLVLNR